MAHMKKEKDLLANIFTTEIVPWYLLDTFSCCIVF